MSIERADKLKNKSKVVKALAKDPTLSERELAKKVNISNGSAHNHKKEIEQNGAESNIMDRILEMDDDIMEMVNGITYSKIKNKIDNDEELTLNDLKILGDLANNSTKRKAIFGDKRDGDDKVTFILS